jgi:MFS family permease
MTIGWPVAATVSGRLYLRFGFRSTTILGAAILVLGLSLLTWSALSPSIWVVAGLCFVIGAGFGFASVPSLVAAQSSVDWNERGVVTGTQLFSRSIGQSIGAAAFGAVANAVILANGGDETVASTMEAAAGAVFLGGAILAAVLLIAAIAMPRTPLPAADAVHEAPAEASPA